MNTGRVLHMARHRSRGYALLLLAWVPGLLGAAEIRPYDEASFVQLNAKGQPVLVDIRTPWCPTCLVQDRHIQAIVAEFGQRDLTVLQVDFDLQKTLVRKFNARTQSTLVMYGGGREVARVVGETRPEMLRGMVARGVLAASGHWPLRQQNR